MEKQDFLNYINAILDQKDSAYFSQNDNHFYFYHKNFMFYLKSTASSAELEINEKKNGDTYTESIDLTAEEAKCLVKKCMALSDSNSIHFADRIAEYGPEKLKDNMEQVKTVLRSPDLEKEVRASKEGNKKITVDGHSILIGLSQIISEYQKRTLLLTSMVKLSIFLSPKGEDKNIIMHELLIPSWEVERYPVLANNFNLKIYGTDFSEKINRIMNNFPSGEEFIKEQLEFLLRKTDKKTPAHKI